MVALLPASAIAQTGGRSNQADQLKTPLTSVAGQTRLDLDPEPDDPGAGGGIDTATFFRTRLLPKLDECTQQVTAVVRDWAAAHQLALARTDEQPGNLVIHATSHELKGFFEVIYRVDARRERARATVFFYSSDGERHEPLGIQSMLRIYQIASFQDGLEGALQCGTKT